jgi:hypothetical protein
MIFAVSSLGGSREQGARDDEICGKFAFCERAHGLDG